jgi:hypothetical protein
LLSAQPAAAQPFEFVYGGPTASEQGNRRVTPVRACPGGGFITVGSTTDPAAPQNVYVVRVRDDGSPMWELAYDVGPLGNDRGQALAEARDGSGFVIAGATNLNIGTGDDVLLMKIRCDGGPMWAFAYHSPLSEGGFDIVEARTGDPAFGTRPGDLLVAGYAFNPAGGVDALLFRTRANGALLWNNRYDFAGSFEFFRGLTEARATGGTSTGDVVGAGTLALPGGTPNGYAIRVSGNTGLITAAPHNAAIFGGRDAEGFDSVVELRVPPLSGSLVLAGSLRSPAVATDIYLARTTPDPSVAVTQRIIGEPAAGVLGEEAAFDIREVLNPLALAPQGSLALTGRAGPAAGTGADAFLLVADPSSLKPFPNRGRLYGDHAAGFEWGFSLSDHARGFILAGFSNSNFEGLVPADPRDLYLVGTDDMGHTGCDLPWDPPHTDVPLPVERISPRAVPFLQQVARPVRVDRMDTAFRNCP